MRDNITAGDIETGPHYLRVRCGDCGNGQLVYSHASSVTRCKVCEKTLAAPRGGKAEIRAQIIEVVPRGGSNE